MKNKEKIVEFAIQKKSIALEKNTNNLVWCKDINCKLDCAFYDPTYNVSACSPETKQKWAEAEYIEPVLDDVERKWLQNLINALKPIKIISISKKPCITEWGIRLLTDSESFIRLDPFNPEEMYTRMKLNKKYTLEELGLEG